MRRRFIASDMRRELLTDHQSTFERMKTNRTSLKKNMPCNVVTQPERRGFGNVSAWVAGVSALILILTILAYYIGLTRQDVYMGLRGIDWKLFQLEKQHYVYLDAISTVETLLTALLALSRNWLLLIGTATIGLVTGIFLLASDRLERKSKNKERKPIDPWKKDFLFILVSTFGMPMVRT